MSTRRDAALFFLAALVPSLAIGLLGQRAIENEGAARERELSVRAAQEADSIARRLVDVTRDRSRALVAPESAPVGPEALFTRAREAAPSFAQALVVTTDARLLQPSLPRPGPATDTAPDCPDEVMALRREPTDELRGRLLDRCEEARDDAGRWLWPVLAIERLSKGDDPALEARAARWIERHVERMTPAEIALARSDVAAIEREGARAVLARALSADGAVARGEVAVAEEAERSVAFRAAVRAAALRPGAEETFTGDGVLGAVVADDGGRAHGFVVTSASIGRDETALAASDARFSAVTARRRPADDAHVRGWSPVTDGLGVVVTLRDPGAVAAERRDAERLLYALLALGVVLAVVLSYALFRRMRETRRTSELRTSFVAGVSHELRTPLASIRMLSELLADDRVEEQERREVVDALSGEALRLSTTVERFLAYAKSERGKLVAERARADVDAVVRGRVEAFRERTGASVELGGAVGEASIDARQLEIVVDNLLENAKKYAPDGEPYRVELTTSDEACVELSVDDAGPGVPASAAARVFRPFERGDDRLSSAVSGTGLGLFLVRAIAEAHQGEARVARSARGGARFTVTLARGTSS